MVLGALAWRGLDLRRVGRAARRYLSASTTHGQLRPRSRRASRARRISRAFILTFLSWSWPGCSFAPTASRRGVYPGENGHPTHISFGRGEIANAMFIAVYAAIAWFAPKRKRSWLRSQEQVVGEILTCGFKRPGFL